MIAVDTSVFILYLQKQQGNDIEVLRRNLSMGEALFSPVVLTELLSAPGLEADEKELILSLPTLDIEYGYWQRAGETRQKVLQKKLKAKLGDALIAQSCIDHDLSLLTRDPDFLHFSNHCGLKLVILPDN